MEKTYSLSLLRVGGYSFLIVGVIALFGVVLSSSTHAKEYSSLNNDCLVLVNKQNLSDLSGAQWTPCYPGMPEYAPVTGKKIVGASTEGAEEYVRSFVENDMTPIPDKQVEREYYLQDLYKNNASRIAHSQSRSSHSSYVPQSQKQSKVYHPVVRSQHSIASTSYYNDDVPYRNTIVTTYHNTVPVKRGVTRNTSSSRKPVPYMQAVLNKKSTTTNTYYHSHYKKVEESKHSYTNRIVRTVRTYTESITKRTQEVTTTTTTMSKKPDMDKKVKKSSMKPSRNYLMVTRHSGK